MHALVSDNYKYLKKVATRIASRRDHRLAGDLLTETYFNIVDKDIKYPTNQEEFLKWFSKCMKNIFVWPNSSFNKMHKSRERATNTIERYAALDEEAMRHIELGAEQTNDTTREILELSTLMGIEKTLKYIRLLEFKKSLLEYEKILFELYFEKNLSTRDIARMYSDNRHRMTHISVNTMVNKIKHKIKEYKWKQ